ncbi:MAG: PSD1 and planctomycete cytochrome C domain-containing protein [Paludisphaera borealis]|uniref:PSD1 and planctomycete cytochrome C domain-containing protein n=1 Tax=Paludisphaera borealis TaxID=1387353 RepID=UPI002844AF72|nr:PSD1 and planctomycete cytochrome C domain-containing protein [Paludisphaera borealis]MDR3621577.1 PSD1 and planctomycete cytochrome C domain-containing protein [Paludisphaera borealis]
MAQVRSAVVLGALTMASAFGTHGARGEERLTFEKDVRPIFKAYCLDCHGGEATKGKLDLRLKRFAEKGGESGPAIVAGNLDESYLLTRLREGEMPPGDKKVPAEQIAIIERWIASGAATLHDEPEKLSPGIGVTTEDRAYWAFQPVRKPAPPAAANGDRARTAIDRFVLAKLRERGLAFASEADRRTLIRRASVDLTGLPPSHEEIESFLADSREDAYERLIDRLLASPHYGERWGRHWLDVAGYADSDGDGADDTTRPYAYKYRDYVIRSLNADKPLDRFIVEQLAGDELTPRPWKDLKPEQVEALAATGYLRMVADGTSNGGGDLALESNQMVADTLKVVGSTFLGLSVGCAQCHDHRYDPIPQDDYYRLRAVFEPALDPSHWRRPGQRLVSLQSDAERAKAAALEAEAQAIQKEIDAKTNTYIAAAVEVELQKFAEPLRGKLREARDTPEAKRTEEQKTLMAHNPSLDISAGVLYQYNQKAADELKKEQERVTAKRGEKPVEDFVSVLDEAAGVRPETHLFHRGDYRQPTKAVAPGDLTIAAPEGSRFDIADADPKAPTSGRRLAYARHLTSGTHPLVGRVLVNRVWSHHFGRGLVDTPGDFGALSIPPSHPELLDWLAAELVDSGWSLKTLHRLIMTSTVYRQSSRRDPAKDQVDSENLLLGRYPVRRLDAESLRDAILAVSGRLDARLHGPAVAVAEDAVGLVSPADDAPRRSVYLQMRRTRPVSFLSAFDAPVMSVNCDRRTDSTSAPQSLMLMNSDFLLNHSAKIAARAQAETPEGFYDASKPVQERRIAYAWRLIYERPISAEEMEWARGFAAEQRGLLDRENAKGDRDQTVLAHLCQQLLNSNEFLYVD